MAKAKLQQPEETAIAPADERATAPRGARRMGKEDYNRARPGQKPVEVTRAWAGVTNGQLVVLHPQHQKRLLRGGFVKEV